MDIRIGIQHAPRELAFDTDASVADIEQKYTAALAANGVLRLSDAKGQEYLIAATGVTYIEFGTAQSRPVGFVS
ncbi:unannotated protein [freshwater metagenome]|jgi:hypothetical protein|uniref:Unannotated protein n=1 Tax=freshwater metagenome TaxID=449393 RepID=A0A6J6J3X7_9ZZZZ|nr:DUF3107 family protein [Actinomycetota bacterium]MUH53053.1 DUF3107 family protein [Actinomycetota bacterium]